MLQRTLKTKDAPWIYRDRQGKPIAMIRLARTDRGAATIEIVELDANGEPVGIAKPLPRR